jgi:hypothetical protein
MFATRVEPDIATIAFVFFRGIAQAFLMRSTDT